MRVLEYTAFPIGLVLGIPGRFGTQYRGLHPPLSLIPGPAGAGRECPLALSGMECRGWIVSATRRPGVANKFEGTLKTGSFVGNGPGMIMLTAATGLRT
jgi:hypothetical protein